MSKPDPSYYLLQMIEKTKPLIFFLLIFFLTSCSFYSKPGIWSGDEEEKRSKGKLSAIERTQKQMKSLSDKLSKLDAKTRQGINPSYTKTLQKFMSAA